MRLSRFLLMQSCFLRATLCVPEGKTCVCGERALTVNNRFAHTRYELKRQFWKLGGANVRVFDPQGNLAFFAHQKAWKLKEDFRIYGDEAKTIELIRIGARK